MLKNLRTFATVVRGLAATPIPAVERTGRSKIRENMSRPSPKTKKPLSYPDETQGSKLAAEMRAKANRLTREQKGRYFSKAMTLIYGGTRAKEAVGVGR